MLQKFKRVSIGLIAIVAAIGGSVQAEEYGRMGFWRGVGFFGDGTNTPFVNGNQAYSEGYYRNWDWSSTSYPYAMPLTPTSKIQRPSAPCASASTTQNGTSKPVQISARAATINPAPNVSQLMTAARTIP